MNNLLNPASWEEKSFPVKLAYVGIYSLICISIILIALSGAWKFSLVILFIVLLLSTSFKTHGNVFVVGSIIVISFLELNFNLTLGPVKGLSFLNLALGSGLILFMVKNLKYHRRLFLKCPLNWALLLLTIYQFGSFIFIYLQRGYSENFTQLFILFKNDINPFLIFFIAFNLPVSKREIQILINFMLGFFIFNVILNALTYFGMVRFIHFLGESPEIGRLSGAYQPGYRLTGSFLGPNAFASYIILFLPLLICAIFFTKNKLKKSLLIFPLFVSLLVIILTGSRGGYIGLAVAVIFLVFLMMKINILKSKKLLLYAAMTLLLIILIALLFQDLFLANVIGRFSFGDDINLDILTKGRFSLWKRGIKEILTSPLFGSGWRNFFPVHNQFLYYLGTLGIIGFLFYAFIYIKSFSLSWGQLKTEKLNPENFINLSFLAGFTGIIVTMQGLVLSYINNFLFLYLGLILRYNSIDTIKKRLSS